MKIACYNIITGPNVVDHHLCTIKFLNTKTKTMSEEKESGGFGWAIWIVVLIVVNLLSWIFDWPFWIY